MKRVSQDPITSPGMPIEFHFSIVSFSMVNKSWILLILTHSLTSIHSSIWQFTGCSIYQMNEALHQQPDRQGLVYICQKIDNMQTWIRIYLLIQSFLSKVKTGEK